MSLVGYTRVSTTKGRQVLDRQLDALNAAGCERVFEDHASGAAADRPNLAACLGLNARDVALDKSGPSAELELAPAPLTSRAPDFLPDILGQTIHSKEFHSINGIATRTNARPVMTTTGLGR